MKLLFTVGLLLFISASVKAQEWNWKPYSPPNQPWTILAPAPLKPDAEAQSNGNKGSFSYNDYNGFFAVIYRDAPRRYLPWKPNYSGYIEQVRDSVADANRGEVIKDSEFVIRGRKVREVQVKFPSGIMRGAEGQIINKYRVQRFRMFFIGKRFYAILAVLAENEIDKPEIKRFLDSFVINTAPIVAADSYSVNEDTELIVNAGKGVLTNDSDAENNALTVAAARPLTPPAHGSLTLNADGSFDYKPDVNFNGTDSFSYKANDGSIDSTSAATVTITVNPVNDAPTISGIPATITVDELAPLGLIAKGSDVDNPPSALRFSLTGAPAGATIDAKTGTFLWIPDEAQGPGVFSFQINVSDGELSSSANISVTVREVNSPPRIANAPINLSVNELETLSQNVQAVDSDIPKQNLTYSLVGAPEGAAINPATGVINWTPTEAQGNNSTYKFTVRVSDGVATVEAPVNIQVKEVNVAPKLDPIGNKTVDEEKNLSFKLSATDADLPANSLSFSMINAPSGATLDPATGVFSWTPTEAQGAGVYDITFRVTDNGTPTLSAQQSLRITVNEVNVAPKLNPIGNKIVDEEKNLSFRVSATDSDIPANALTYTMTNSPAGATLDPATGVFSWTPTEAQGAGNYAVTFRVTDNGTPALSAQETINITVNEVNVAPKLDPIGNKTVDEEKNLSFKLSATDADLPANSLSFSMINAPSGATLDPATGVFSWTPTEAQGAGVYDITFRVTDNGTPTLSAQQSLRITVNEVNKPPVAENSSVNLDEDTSVTINLKGSDADLPANNLIYSVISQPTHGKIVGSNSNLTYQPNANFNGSDSFTFKINDGLLDSNAATVRINVKPVNDAPTANADNATTNQDVPVVINVLANDTDIDGDRIVLTNIFDVVNGKAEIDGDQVKFTPNANFSGIGSFRYAIGDGHGGTSSGVVTVTITRTKPNN